MKKRTTSYIRLLHAAPNAPAVDIFANDDILLTESLDFSEFTPYIPVQAGTYNIDVYPEDNTEMPVLSPTLNIPENKIYTIAVTGILPDLEIVVIEDVKEEIPKNKLGLRFVHLSPNAPAVDIYNSTSENPLFEDIEYKEVSNYLFIPPSTYTIDVTPKGSSDIVLRVPNMRLQKNRFYTVYAVGLIGDNPPLQVLIPLDGNSYLA